MNTETRIAGQRAAYGIFDRRPLIVSRLQRTITHVKMPSQLPLHLAAQAIYEFTWNEYCDWYLELSKPVLQSPDSSAAAQRGTRIRWSAYWNVCYGSSIPSCLSSPKRSGSGRTAGRRSRRDHHAPALSAGGCVAQRCIHRNGNDWLMRFILACATSAAR